jgi:hypothetical protein
MRIYALTLVVASWLATTPALAQTSARTDTVVSVLGGTVRGRFEGRARALAYAVIEVRTGSFSRATVADSLGHYVIQGLPPGQVRVRATHAGHDPLSLAVVLPPDGSVRVDLELRARPVELMGVDVRGEPERDVSASVSQTSGTPIPDLEVEALDVGPGVAHPGIVDAVRALPGNDPADATDVLFMRGSTTDLKLVLLDGVPVYTPFHVGGLMRSFEPSVLSRADLHVGGAPARYDGGLTHILDMHTRRARRDRLRASGAIDLLSVSGALETPLGPRAGVIVSGRSLHDLGSGPLGGKRPYGYRDLLVSLSTDPGERHTLSATGFWNTEAVRLEFDHEPDDAVWSNRAGSLGYVGTLGPARLDLTAGASGYRAELPLQPSGTPGEPPPPPLRASAAIDRMRLVAETTWGAPERPVRVGMSLERFDAEYSAAGGVTSSGGRASTTTAGTYVDVTRPLGPGVTLRAGLRGDVFTGIGARVAPRAAIHWEVGPTALLTVAAGRYHQPTRTPDFEVERTLAEVADSGVDPSELLPVATADHVVLSLDQRLAGRVSLGLEGFWKRYEGLVESSRETVRSSGVDLRVLSSGDFGAAWLGYGLSWFWSTVDLSGHASDFAGRHLLTAGISGGLGGPFRGEARLAYGAGLPYTSVPFRGDFASDQSPTSDLAGPGEELIGDGSVAPERSIVGGLDEEFLRVDVELHAVLEPHWGGRPWTVRPYLRILNALDRRDALFYTFQTWRPDSVRPLAERSILPLLGVAFSF